MSSWSYEPNRVRIHRPDPNSPITWLLALTAPVQAALGIWILLATDPPVRVLLGLVGAAAGWALAVLDVRRTALLPSRVRTSPALAALSPLAHLLVRMLRDPDARAARPLWSGVALIVPAVFLLAVAVLGRYAAVVHGY